MAGLGRSRISPDALTAAGVGLSILGAVVVWFEYLGWGWFWVGAALFVVGAILDILDGALARAGGKSTVFGAFLDSTTDRVGEFFMLAAIAYVFAVDGRDVFVVVAVAAVAGSLLVSYTRARAEALGLDGKAGLMGRAERVVLLAAILATAPWGTLPYGIALLAVTASATVARRAATGGRARTGKASTAAFRRNFAGSTGWAGTTANAPRVIRATIRATAAKPVTGRGSAAKPNATRCAIVAGRKAIRGRTSGSAKMFASGSRMHSTST